MFAVFLLVLWYTQPWRPALTLWEAVLVMVLPSLLLGDACTHAAARLELLLALAHRAAAVLVHCLEAIDLDPTR